MEALKADLDKAINACMKAICEFQTAKEGEVLVKGQPFEALNKTIDSILTFHESQILEISNDNDRLAKANDGLQRKVDLLLTGIRHMDLNGNQSSEETKAVSSQLLQESHQMKATNENLRQKVLDYENKIQELEGRISEAAALPPKADDALEMEMSALRGELEEKNKTIANMVEENRRNKSEIVQLEKNMSILKKMMEDQNDQIRRLENPGYKAAAAYVHNRGSIHRGSPTPSLASREPTPVSLPRVAFPVSLPRVPSTANFPGDPEQYILLKDALVDNKLNFELIGRKILVVKRLLSTDDSMVWDAYSTFDDVNEKPIKINIKFATFKFYLDGTLRIHKRISPLLFTMIDSCSLVDLRLYYVTISYSQLLKLIGTSGTLKCFYSIFVVIKDEHQQDMQIDKILREVSGVEVLSFVFPNGARVTADTFAQLHYFSNLKKVTFGNIPVSIDESVIRDFKKKYPNVNCQYTWNDLSNKNNR